MKQAVVLCGGLGTRLGPLAADTPKILLPIAGRPFLHHLVDRLEDCGFEDVILCAGHLGALVADAVSEGPTRMLSVRVSHDGVPLLGTAGALRKALPLLERTFLVTYGDSYLTFDYASPLEQLERHASALGCGAVYANRDQIEPSNIALRADLIVRYDKRRAPGDPPLDHIDYGATALRREAIAQLPANTTMGFDELQSELARREQLLAHVTPDRFYEIGSVQGVAELEAHLSAS